VIIRGTEPDVQSVRCGERRQATVGFEARCDHRDLFALTRVFSGVLARVNNRMLTSRPSTPSRRSPFAHLQAFLSGPCRDRTYDLGIKSPLLYQLS
jgi:hypothetical protein